MKSNRLPLFLKNLFWDYDFRRLNWENDRHLIMARVLSAGDWEAVNWLRHQIGEDELKHWLIANRGKGLSPQRLRFWELILNISHHQVSAWLKDTGRTVWDERGREMIWQNRVAR